jgi:hypothetical protein
MVNFMGKISKGIKCNIESCENQAARSLSIDKVTKLGFKVKGAKKAYLCKEHYKEYKKKAKKGKMLDKWRYAGGRAQKTMYSYSAPAR